MNETTRTRIFPVISWLFLLLAAFVLVACPAGESEPPLTGAAIGGPFTLTGHNGRRASDTNFRGKYLILYFGFSHCPDVCPADLAQIGQGLRRFEKTAPARAVRVQPFFITVDPERDTPAVLRQYVAAFHPRLIGLTGTAEEIAAVARRYGVHLARQPSQGASGYAIDHSRIAYLFGPKGEPIAILPQDRGAAAVAAELDRWVR